MGNVISVARTSVVVLENRIPVVADDSWGGEITAAAVAHFAATMPAEFLINSTDLHNDNTVRTGIPGPETWDGRLLASHSPGLGLVPDDKSLRAPVASYPVP